MLRLILLFLLFISAGNLISQTAHKYLRSGDQQYSSEEYAAAEELYRKADRKKSTLKSSFNLGNSTFQQGRFAESIDFYLNAARKTKTKVEESDAMYNLGNAYFNNEELEEAIEAFKQAVRLNPNNKEAKYNLAVAKEIKKQMMQQQQEQEQQDQQENQDSENQEQQENQEQGEQQEQQDQEQQQEQQDSTQQIQESQFDSTRLDKQELDSLDAAKLLMIIQSEEQKVQEKLRKFNSERKKPDKDW